MPHADGPSFAMLCAGFPQRTSICSEQECDPSALPLSRIERFRPSHRNIRVLRVCEVSRSLTITGTLDARPKLRVPRRVIMTLPEP